MKEKSLASHKFIYFVSVSEPNWLENSSQQQEKENHYTDRNVWHGMTQFNRSQAATILIKIGDKHAERLSDYGMM